MSPEFLLQLFAAIAAAVGGYAAIRSDLTRAIVLAERASEDAGEVRTRLDRHIENHPQGT